MTSAALAREKEAPIRVLLIDDDEDEHVIVGDLLSTALGDRFNLAWVSTYEDGLASLRSAKFDVCLVDYRLGARSGLELLAEAMLLPGHTEVILLTGEGDINVDIEATRAGAADYLVKHGLTPGRLERSVRYAVEHGRATAKLRQLLGEKDMLIQEVHHRVKNNLQVICSLLSLQMASVADERSAEPLRQAFGRILAMSMIHEHLHGSESLLALDFAVYIHSLATSLFAAYNIDPQRIRLDLATDTVHLPVDEAITCGLILNELVSNALKHAFTDGRPGRLKIAFRQVPPDRLEVTVADDGVGLLPDFHVETARSLGWEIVRCLLGQLGATVHLYAEEGTRVVFSWYSADIA